VGKRATTPSIAGIDLDRRSDTPLHEQIDAAFRRAILDGRLRGGARIPSSRALAEQLGVSRLTVVTAFERLTAEGYLESLVGSGTRVACVLPAERFTGQRASTRAPSRLGELPQVRLSRRGSTIARFAPRREAQQTAPRPFRVGAPALDAFPYPEWVRLSAACRRRIRREHLGYGEPAGYRPLREAIAEYLGPTRGVRCRAENVIVVSGAQQAFGLALQLLTDPGDTVWVEDPGYPGARGAATAAGVRLRPVEIDSEGLVLEPAAKSEVAPRLVFATPSHQFPLGVTMSLARRLALLQWASDVGATIVEDDYGSEYRYTGRPLSALQGLDGDDRVVYVGTFSKVLFPALRMAYVVAPSHLVDAFAAAKGLFDGHAPLLEQATVAAFIREGGFARHLARMRVLYRDRQSTLLEAARRHLPGLLTVQPTETGMHLVAWLPSGVDDRTAAEAAVNAGIEAAPLSAFCINAHLRPGLVLGFASTPSAEIDAATGRLASALEKLAYRGKRKAKHSPRAPARAGKAT
jgi:GntR family transcriptional regulator/MocR family aminotransferase